MYLNTWMWMSGSNDGVLGNDGSPNSCTNSMNPAMIQGIEYSVGGYDVLSDVILWLDETDYCQYVVADESNKTVNATNTTTGYQDTG